MNLNPIDMENTVPSTLECNNIIESNSDITEDEKPVSSFVIGGSSKGESLQDAFAKFREQKKSERRLLKACSAPGSRSAEYKEQLRSKFIEQAHKYIGVPYHEKYREEGTEIAPLYLDCCGLVRQCVKDLKEDFGFLIGRWNQAYQMDTLPDVVTFEQLKPGDLIFYEGIFNSKRSKPQKHNNVHVEIYLGGETGESTIGARFQKGVVSVFPSYKFVSKSWDLVQYHFRSIDAWLDGRCISHCIEHPWISESGSLYAAAGRKSIFNDDEEGDEGAGDDFFDQESPRAECHECRDPLDTAEVDEECPPGEGDSGDELGGGDAEFDSAEEIPRPLDPVLLESASISNIVESVFAAPSNRSSVGDLVARDDESPSLSVDGGLAAINSSDSSSGKFKSGRRVNSLRNSGPTAHANATITSAEVPIRSSIKQAVSPSRMRQKLPPRVRKAESGEVSESTGDVSCTDRNASPSRATGAPTLSSKAAKTASDKQKRDMMQGQPLPKTYYVHKSNGWRLVCAALDRRGWQQLPFEYNMSTRFTLKWVERRSQIDYKAHIPGQLVNHIINNDCFTTKLGLLNTLRDYFCRSSSLGSSSVSPLRGAKGPSTNDGSKKASGTSSTRISFDDMILSSAPRLPTPWMMESYQLDQALDCSAVLKEDEEAFLSAKDASAINHLWIYKPTFGNRGRGVHVVRGGRELKELVVSYVAHYHPNLMKSEAFAPLSSFVKAEPAGASSTAEEASAVDDEAACFGRIPKALIQRYVMNPLLVEGYKFDIRCYMLVARNDPTYLAFYHPGYCRFTLMPYSYEESAISDPFVHLTNAAVQKKHPNYAERKDMQILAPEVVIEKLIAQGDVESAAYMRDQMDSDMMSCMLDVLKAAKVKLTKRRGYFDLYGFDFMLRNPNMPSGLVDGPRGAKVALRNDPKRRLILLETNTNPAMSLDNATLEGMLPHVIDGTLELVLASNLAPDASGDCAGALARSDYCDNLPSRFRLLYDEASGFEYGRSNSAPAPSSASAKK